LFCLLLLAAFAFATSLLTQARGIAEANPAYVRAVGEQAVLEAAAAAVRADTTIATLAPIALWLALIGALLFVALEAAALVWLAGMIWRERR
jgi:hypothetical protein